MQGQALQRTRVNAIESDAVPWTVRPMAILYGTRELGRDWGIGIVKTWTSYLTLFDNFITSYFGLMCSRCVFYQTIFTDLNRHVNQMLYDLQVGHWGFTSQK